MMRVDLPPGANRLLLVLAALADGGVTHLLTLPWVFYAGFTDDLQERLDGIRRFADDVIEAW